MYHSKQHALTFILTINLTHNPALWFVTYNYKINSDYSSYRLSVKHYADESRCKHTCDQSIAVDDANEPTYLSVKIRNNP